MKKTRMDNIADDYFGTTVKDPYRWLEDPKSPDTIAWVEKENKLTFQFLEKVSERKKIKERLTELWDYPKYTVPIKKGNYYFFKKNDGLQNQAVLYRQEGLTGKAELIIDPNKFTEDGTAALSSVSYNEDGELMAYGVSYHGSDWQEIKILDLKSEKEYDEIIKWSRGGGVAWMPDSSGFYYSRYSGPEAKEKVDEAKYHRTYFHRLGTAQSEDRLIYERPDDKELSFYPFISDDGKYLFLHVVKGCTPKNQVFYRKLDSEEPFIELIDKPDGKYNFIDNIDELFYFDTDLNAPRGK